MTAAGFGRKPQLEEKMLTSEEKLSRLKGVGSEKQVLRAEERVMGAQEHLEQLLPGIPNEITLAEITTKLQWREFFVLACVSRGWHSAIHNRQVYDARVRSRTTETFVIADHIDHTDCGGRKSRLIVCCLRDNSCLELPPIPQYDEGNPWLVSVAVDGKVYVLGSVFDEHGPGGTVYMFDLAGQRLWTQCVSMLIPRHCFGCGLMDGKIYVFGGSISGRQGYYPGFSCEAEVFDPKENRWSLITPMPVSRYSPEVVPFGEELIVYRGVVEKGPYDQRTIDVADADCLEIYCPLKDEWRMVSDPFRRPFRRIQDRIFVAQGKLHSLNPFGIYVRNFDGNSCKKLHSNSFAAMEEADSSIVHLLPLVPLLFVDDELLARGTVCNESRTINRGRGFRAIIFRSRGFGSEKKEMTWREEKDWLSKGFVRSIHAIQL